MSLEDGVSIDGVQIPCITAAEVRLASNGVSQLHLIIAGPIKLTASTTNVIIDGKELEDDVVRRALYDQLKAFYEYEL